MVYLKLNLFFMLYLLKAIQSFIFLSVKHKLAVNNHNVLKLSIDPLDQIKVSPSSSNAATNRTINYNTNKSVIGSSIGNNDLNENRTKVETKKKSKTDLFVDIELYEAKLLDMLPINLFNYFISFCEKYTIRVSLIAFTIHIMMLIPILRYIKIDLGMSIIPYIYLGPIVALIPFMFYWLWLNNFIEIKLFDDKFNKYVKMQQESAILKLQNEEETMLEILQYENDPDTLKLLATCKLFKKINLKAIKDEVYTLKYKTGISKSKLLKLDNIDNNTSYNKNSISSAVQLLLQSTSDSGESNEEVLKQLKKLKEDVSDIN